MAESRRRIWANTKYPTLKISCRLRTTFVRGDDGASPFQSKEIGESAISQVAPAIANAVYDAVGVRIIDLPITAEKVFRALQAAPKKNHGLRPIDGKIRTEV